MGNRFSRGAASVVVMTTLVAVSACSSSGKPSSSNPASSKAASSPAATSSAAGSASTSSAKTSSTTGVSSAAARKPAAAAQKYLGLTAPIDSSLQAFLRLPNRTPAGQVRAAAGKAAKDESVLIGKLKAGVWPASAKPASSNLEATAAKEQAVYAKCSKGSTVPQIKSILTQGRAAIAARIAAAQHVRVDLGLPAAG